MWLRAGVSVETGVMNNGSPGSLNGIDLEKFYRDMCSRGREALLSGDVEVSEYLDDLSQDKRLGLTFIVRPSADVAHAMEDIITRLDAAVPDLLFCYDRLRFHFTILSLIHARKGFHQNKLVVQAFEELIAANIDGFLPFDVEFRGICATRNSVIAKGFPVGNGLENLRNALRSKLKDVGLNSDTDHRYRIAGAHVTLCRFKQSAHSDKLVPLLDSLGETPLGRMRAMQAQLVCNDFYMTPGKVTTCALIPNPRCRVIHNVPDAFPGFVGREREIDDVMRALTAATANVVVLRAFGGMGKSELAKVTARNCADVRWPFRFICWVDLRSYAEISMRLTSIMDSIALAADRRSDVPSILDEEEKRLRTLATLKAQPSLVIFDNYEDLRKDEEEETKVAHFVASLPCGSSMEDGAGFVRVLVTTRELLSLSKYGIRDGIRELSLERLPFREADSFMTSLAVHDRDTGKELTREQRRMIYDTVQGVPKLITVAMDQLRAMGLAEWRDTLHGATWNALFAHAWNRLLSENMRCILMSLVHFAGEAKAEALRAVASLDRDAFWHELAYTSNGAWLMSTGTGYVAHPLAIPFYRRKLQENNPFSRCFRTESAGSFIKYFRALVEEASGRRDFDAMEQEIRNITAAARLADSLTKELPPEQAEDIRRDLIHLVESARDFLWVRGWWRDYEEMAQLAGKAAEELRELHYTGLFLCLDLGWLALRREDLKEAEERARRGMQLFRDLGEEENLATMTRHMGKLNLLRGLDQTYYEPGEQWEAWSEKALELYNESLEIRSSIKHRGINQDQAVADLKLDLGRLHWLDGQYHERVGWRKSDPARLDHAFSKYKLCYRLSREAIDACRIGVDRGLLGKAKAWGNCGNAARQMARLLAKRQDVQNAKPWMNRARAYYTKSLELARTILRRDEMAHAYWGLGEVHVLQAALARGAGQPQMGRSLLLVAERLVEESHRLYKALAGPRDVNSTARLLRDIQVDLGG
jgi:hypothetical protein